MSNKEIAATFGISKRTVETYVRRLKDRLGVESRPQIAVYYLIEEMIARSAQPQRRDASDATGSSATVASVIKSGIR